MSMKKTFLKEIYKLLGETDDGNVRSLARTVAPDVVDLAGLLRSSGFRVSRVDLKPIARASLSSAGSKSTCSVQLTCARSGLNVLLESEGVCRCPEAATSGDDSVSMWIVESPVSPSCSQENLNKSEQAGSSLLPEVPVAVAEVVSVAVACIMKLIREECVPGKAGNVGSRASVGQKSMKLSLSAESVLQDVAQPGTDLFQTRSLDDMSWQAMSKNIAPSFQELSISAISSTSKSEEQLAVVVQQPSLITASEVSNQPLSTLAKDMPPPPRRQSSTVEDYLKFKQCLGDNDSVAIPSRTSTESHSSGGTDSAASACVITAPMAQQMLEKVQLARQNLDELLLTLKECIENPDIGEAATPVAAAQRATRPKLKSASGGIPVKKTEGTPRPRSTTKATVLQAARRETVAMPPTLPHTPRPLQRRPIMSPAPLPRIKASPKSPYAPPTPVPRRGKGTVAKSRPKQVQRRHSAGSSPSGPSSLTLLPGSPLLSGNLEASSTTHQRRVSTGVPRMLHEGGHSLPRPRKN